MAPGPAGPGLRRVSPEAPPAFLAPPVIGFVPLLAPPLAPVPHGSSSIASEPSVLVPVLTWTPLPLRIPPLPDPPLADPRRPRHPVASLSALTVTHTTSVLAYRVGSPWAIPSRHTSTLPASLGGYSSALDPPPLSCGSRGH